MNYNDNNSKNYYKPLYKDHFERRVDVLFFEDEEGNSIALETLGLEVVISSQLISRDKISVSKVFKRFLVIGYSEERLNLLLDKVIELSEGDITCDGEYIYSASNDALNEEKEAKDKRKSYNGTRAFVKQLLKDNHNGDMTIVEELVSEKFSDTPSNLKELLPLVMFQDKEVFNTRFEQPLPISNYKQSA